MSDTENTGSFASEYVGELKTEEEITMATAAEDPFLSVLNKFMHRTPIREFTLGGLQEVIDLSEKMTNLGNVKHDYAFLISADMTDVLVNSYRTAFESTNITEELNTGKIGTLLDYPVYSDRDRTAPILPPRTFSLAFAQVRDVL